MKDRVYLGTAGQVAQKSNNKKLLGARASLLVTKGITASSKDATSSSWH